MKSISVLILSLMIFLFVNCQTETKPNCAFVNAESANSILNRWLIIENGKFGYIDRNGNKAISCRFDSASTFFFSFALVKENNQCYFIDTNGNMAFNQKYEQACPFFDGKVAAVQINGKWGLINTSGTYLINPDYDQVIGLPDPFFFHPPFMESFVESTKKLNDLVATRPSSMVDTFSYLNYDVAYGYTIAKERNGLYQLISISRNKEKINAQFNSLSFWSYDLLGVMQNDYWGFIDTNGRIISECIYHLPTDNREGSLINVKETDTCQIASAKVHLLPNGISFESYYDPINKQSWPLLNYSKTYPFSDSLDQIGEFKFGKAFAKKNGQYFLIDSTGQRQSEHSFDQESYFDDNGTAIVHFNKHVGLINACGETILDLQFQNILGMSEGMIAVMQNEKWGFYSVTGKKIISPKYAQVISNFASGIALVEIDQQVNGVTKKTYSYINKEGLTIWSYTLN
jgi:WG containing repeat